MNGIKKVLAQVSLDTQGLETLNTLWIAITAWDGIAAPRVVDEGIDRIKVRVLGLEGDPDRLPSRWSIRDAREVLTRVVDEDDPLTQDMVRIMFEL